MNNRETFNELLAGPGCLVLVNLHADGITGIPFEAGLIRLTKMSRPKSMKSFNNAFSV